MHTQCRFYGSTYLRGQRCAVVSGHDILQVTPCVANLLHGQFCSREELKMGLLREYYTRCAHVCVLGLFRRHPHVFNSEVHVFPSCKRHYYCTYSTVSP